MASLRLVSHAANASTVAAISLSEEESVVAVSVITLTRRHSISIVRYHMSSTYGPLALVRLDIDGLNSNNRPIRVSIC